MGNLCVLRLFQIDENGTCCHRSGLKMFHTEPLEVFYVKVFQEFLTSRGVIESPVVEFEDKIFSTVKSDEAFLTSALHQYFLGCETTEEFVNTLRRSLGKQKFARRDV